MDLPRAPFYDKELDLRLSRSYGPGRYDPNYELHGLDYPIGHVRWTEQRNMDAFLRSGGRCARSIPSELITHRFDFGEAERPSSSCSRGTGSSAWCSVRVRTAELEHARRTRRPRAHRPQAGDGPGSGLVGAGLVRDRRP